MCCFDFRWIIENPSTLCNSIAAKMEQSLASVMKNINDALRLDHDSHEKVSFVCFFWFYCKNISLAVFSDFYFLYFLCNNFVHNKSNWHLLGD